MHCSAVLSLFDMYYRLDNMFESLNYIHPHNPGLPPPPPPGFVYSRRPLVTLRPPSQETVTPDRRAPLRRSRMKRIFGAYFYFSRFFWLCQDRLEHHLGWNRASGREKERDFPRVVLSSASKKSENVRFPSLFPHGCLSRMSLISKEHNVTFSFHIYPLPEKESRYFSQELGC